MSIPSGKGKQICVSQEKVSSSEEDTIVSKDVFNFSCEDISSVLGLAKESSISLFKLVKWVFHELNMTNVQVHWFVSKVGESSAQSQIDELFEPLKNVAKKTFNMKEMLELRIVTLKDQMDRLSANLEKGGEGNKSIKLKYVGIYSPVVMAKKSREMIPGGVSDVVGRPMEEDVTVDKDGDGQHVLISEVNLGGPGAHTCNKTKIQGGAPTKEMAEVMNEI